MTWNELMCGWPNVWPACSPLIFPAYLALIPANFSAHGGPLVLIPPWNDPKLKEFWVICRKRWDSGGVRCSFLIFFFHQGADLGEDRVWKGSLWRLNSKPKVASSFWWEYLSDENPFFVFRAQCSEFIEACFDFRTTEVFIWCKRSTAHLQCWSKCLSARGSVKLHTSDFCFASFGFFASFPIQSTQQGLCLIALHFTLKHVDSP